MGCCTSKQQTYGTYSPSNFAITVAVKKTTNYQEETYSPKNTEGAKVLVICTDDGKLKMSNGKVFNSGNHPTETLLPLMHFKAAGFALEFATVSGKPVVIEMWGFPVKDAAVTAFFNKLKPLLEAPTKLEDVDASLAGYAGLFIPGGHGAMVNLPDSVALGKLLHTAHAASLPTVALCHGPAALLAASKIDGVDFPYKGYQLVSFSDKTDKTTPKIGYIPGAMPWLMQEALNAKGMKTLNSSEKGATHVDRELITGDSPAAANALGKLAAPLLVAAWAKAH